MRYYPTLILRYERDERNKHLFERDATVLKRARIILSVVVEIIGITEEILTSAEYVAR